MLLRWPIATADVKNMKLKKPMKENRINLVSTNLQKRKLKITYALFYTLNLIKLGIKMFFF